MAKEDPSPRLVCPRCKGKGGTVYHDGLLGSHTTCLHCLYCNSTGYPYYYTLQVYCLNCHWTGEIQCPKGQTKGQFLDGRDSTYSTYYKYTGPKEFSPLCPNCGTRQLQNY